MRGGGNQTKEEKTVTIIKKVIEQPTFVEKIVEVPKYVTKEVEIIKPNIVEQKVTSAKIVETIVNVTKPVMKVKEIEQVVRVPKVVYEEEHREILVPVLKDKDVIVNRPKFVEKVVEVIKPKYLCQNCNHEVR